MEGDGAESQSLEAGLQKRDALKGLPLQVQIPGSNPSSDPRSGILGNVHTVPDFQSPVYELILITVPASWVAVRIKSDNKWTVLGSVAELWYYVQRIHSKCSINGSYLYQQGCFYCDKNPIQ